MFIDGAAVSVQNLRLCWYNPAQLYVFHGNRRIGEHVLHVTNRGTTLFDWII